MLVDLVNKYRDIVQSLTVMEFEQVGPYIRLKAKVLFKNESTLFIRQNVISENHFKYAYHWQDKEGNVICRWDNAPHWPDIATHPHHKHLRSESGELRVLESSGGDLDSIFEQIISIDKSQKT